MIYCNVSNEIISSKNRGLSTLLYANTGLPSNNKTYMMIMESTKIDNLIQFYILELNYIFSRLIIKHVANIVAIHICVNLSKPR